MREFDALRALKTSTAPRSAEGRDIRARIWASERGREFFDGDRRNGYGGYADDGRWGPVAESMVADYGLRHGEQVLQLQCEKGFLLGEFAKRGFGAWGTESSLYAIMLARANERITVAFAQPSRLPFQDKTFDLVIAIGVVYALSLQEAITCLREIDRIGTRAFITLGSYESDEDLALFRRWTLNGCTVLSKAEWLEVMAHAGYHGDYKFVTARSLGVTA